ncbi:carbon-nitrogen hydrolase family protein [Tistrella bauzanensis]|nr:carbon-nitrogen hydrolase family protein [Tistrella bauzanensis]
MTRNTATHSAAADNPMPAGVVRVACIQTTATPDMAGGLDRIDDAVGQAAAGGAALAMLPEMSAMLAPGPEQRAAAVVEDDHPAVGRFAAIARRHGIWLHCGSLAVATGDAEDDRLANRTLVFDGQGRIAARYDKIHLFDVGDLADGQSYRESDRYRPGDRAVVIDTPAGRMGLSICYDLRFPALYQALATAGATIIAIPSAFTVPTGRAHWHALIRARAIECGAWVMAPAQTGEHYPGRRTYGHSLIVDPWGRVVAEAAEETGETVIFADIDPAAVTDARAKVPSLSNRRDFLAP